MNKKPKLRLLLEQVKSRYFVGLHHNWHDHAFNYDPLFDFSMAGDGDLIEAAGKPFPRIPLDACNFAPEWFSNETAANPFWDVFNVARAVEFKGIPQFFTALRALYNRGHKVRVLFLCAVSPIERLAEIPNIRAHFESMFTASERQLFTLMTMNWDYPFPLDTETLAFFFRSSRVFVHPAPEERRCRTAAYAWASGIPVVARPNAASILPSRFMRPPFFFGFDSYSDMPDAILSALRQSSPNDDWSSVAQEFQAKASAQKLDVFLRELAPTLSVAKPSEAPINCSRLDIRLGRHHRLSVEQNRVGQDLEAFLRLLLAYSDDRIADIAGSADPEAILAASDPAPSEVQEPEGNGALGARALWWYKLWGNRGSKCGS